MARKRKRIAPEFGAVIHDHFSGSAHCRECGGECKLTGSDRALTLTAAQAELCERVADKVIADYTGLTIGPPNPASTDQLQMRIARALRSALYGERELQEEPQ